MKRILQIAAIGLKIGLKIAQYLLTERPETRQLRAIDVQAQPIEPQAIAQAQPQHPTPDIQPLTPVIAAAAPQPQRTRATSTVHTTKATQQRSQLVTTLLDEAFGKGLKTYDQLQGYVQTHTGTACSRRTISNWKKSRELDNAAA